MENDLGYIDNSSKVVLGLRYNGAKCFKESLAAVKFDNKWGFVNKLGQFVL